MPRERGEKVVATNRKARHDYLISDTYEAGMVLSGTEVKSLRAGRATLVDGYAFIEGGEAWLDAVHIPEYSGGSWTNHPPRRKRKLLLHKKEIVKISHRPRRADTRSSRCGSTSRMVGPRLRSPSPRVRKSTTSARRCGNAPTSANRTGRCRRSATSATEQLL